MRTLHLIPRTGMGALPWRRPARESARVSVLLGLVLLVATHGWLAFAVETRRPEWRDPEFFHRQKRAAGLIQWEHERGCDRPLVAIIGGSRPQMGLSPEELNRILDEGDNSPVAYNCSQSGALPIGEYLNLCRLLEGKAPPRFVLIEVLPPVLADPGPMENRLPLLRLSHKDLSRLEPYFTDPDRARRDWLSARMASWCTLRSSLLANWRLSETFPTGRATTHHLWMNMTFHGWSPFAPAVWTVAQREAQVNVAHGSYSWLLDDFSVQPVNDRLYRDMLEMCRSRGVGAALFTMPESPVFRSWYSSGVRQRINEHLGSLSRQFGVPYFDTAAWVEDETAFMDGHHLLHDSAVAFSYRFGKECVAPWLSGK